MKKLLSLNCKNIFMFVAIAIMFSVGFIACNDKDGNDGQQKPKISLNDYFAIQDAELIQGAIPSTTNGKDIGEITINNNILAGGSSHVSIKTENSIQKLYVGVKGIGAYYTITPSSISKSTIIDFVILFSQSITEAFEIQISALLDDGTLTPIYTKRITLVSAGTGGLQISLSFDNEKDVDLYVVQPDGEIIYYGNHGGDRIYDTITGKYIYTWGLDVDSNPGCNIDSINNENVFYPNEYIQSGVYQVWINMYSNCDPSIATNWVVTALKAGQLITPTFGDNPKIGTFPINEPSNGIGSSLTGALKVMEFSVQGTNTPAKKKSISPLTESAKMKLMQAKMRN